MRAADRESIQHLHAPIFDADHRMTGCIEVFQDHSAFRDLIKRIRFEDLRLKIILDNLDIGVLTVDRGNHISFFNTMAETITGYARAELLGMLKPGGVAFALADPSRSLEELVLFRRLAGRLAGECQFQLAERLSGEIHPGE